MTTKESSAHKSRGRKIAESLACGSVVGFICGFIGAGGGMMMLLVLTSVLGYELKTAVGDVYKRQSPPPSTCGCSTALTASIWSSTR